MTSREGATVPAEWNLRALLSRSVAEVGVFSFAINLLLLVPPLYLMQIYDRVIRSSSVDTLIYITLIAGLALLVLGLLEIARSLYTGRVASRLATRLGPVAFLSAIESPKAGYGDIQPIRDLATVRSFISSRSLTSLFDLPFMPVFLLLLFFVHPLLFWVAVTGVVVLVAVAVSNQRWTGRYNQESGEALLAANNTAQSCMRSRESIRALGMMDNLIETWGEKYARSLNSADRVARAHAIFGGSSRMVRLLLQIAILGSGAYLVLNQEMTASMIFASSIVSGRALQPLDQIIGGWQNVAEAARSWKRLSTATSGTFAGERRTTAMPEPEGALSVEDVVYFAPGARKTDSPIIKRASFKVEAGESVTLIGPSQAGKSTLARLIVGAIGPDAGTVRIDGADIRNWNPNELGKHIGYLSQEADLLPGTIAENIARFDPDAKDADIIDAARMAHAHELILGMRDGYDTPIGPGGVRLSGGERQRIGLARAFYGRPTILVLDEPNANLDVGGETALQLALQEAHASRMTVFLVTHRPSLATKCTRVLLLKNGRVELFGPAEEVLQRLQETAGEQAPRQDTASAGGKTPSGKTAVSGSFSKIARVS